MNNIPTKLRAQLQDDPFYQACARRLLLNDHECQGDPVRGAGGRMIEWEHALTYAGKQVQKRYAIVPLCWWAHRGPGQDKDIGVWVALNRATTDELLKLSHKGGKDYFLHKAYLNRRYGAPDFFASFVPPGKPQIAY